jgi:hypothetical protein
VSASILSLFDPPSKYSSTMARISWTLVDFLADYMIVQRTIREDLRRLEAVKAPF